MANHPGPSSSFASIEDKEFDIIIIGGGTAGLVVAHRLTEDTNTRVLVIEAGGDRKDDPRVYTPGLMSMLYGDPEVDWDYMTPPQVCWTNS
jgi:choline dehydrogenase-like flavoprotein